MPSIAALGVLLALWAAPTAFVLLFAVGVRVVAPRLDGESGLEDEVEPKA